MKIEQVIAMLLRKARLSGIKLYWSSDELDEVIQVYSTDLKDFKVSDVINSIEGFIKQNNNFPSVPEILKGLQEIEAERIKKHEKKQLPAYIHFEEPKYIPCPPAIKAKMQQLFQKLGAI